MRFKKYFKIKYVNSLTQYSSLYSGSIGLKAISRFNLTIQQLNATIRSVKRIIRKKNFLIVNCLPFWGITRKPRDIRMGRGKGSLAIKVFPVKPGKIILEAKIGQVGVRPILRAFKYCALRLPAKTMIVKKYDKRTDSIKGSW